jgi:hypothetical protein
MFHAEHPQTCFILRPCSKESSKPQEKGGGEGVEQMEGAGGGAVKQLFFLTSACRSSKCDLDAVVPSSKQIPQMHFHTES